MMIMMEKMHKHNVTFGVSLKETVKHTQFGLCYTLYRHYKLYVSCGKKEVKRRQPKNEPDHRLSENVHR